MRSHPVKCSSSNEISICKIGNHCKNANAHMEKQELVIGPQKKTFFFVVKFSVVIILLITIYTPFFKQRELPKKDFGLGR